MIYQIFREAVSLYPNAVALVNSQGRHWTYAELDQVIQQWAHYLHDLGIAPQDRVAVLLKNEDLHIFIFLALERIQASYIPFDDSIPAQQLAQDLKRLTPKQYLRDADFSPEVLEKIAQHPLQFDEHPYLINQGMEHITYWVSSSGTTGEKKWIPILGKGLDYWARQLRALMQLQPNDKVLATRSPAYDARIFEYLEAFACGSTLCLVDRHQRKDMQAIIKICEQQHIASLLFIASQFNEANLEDTLKRLKQSGLTHLLVTGDACTPHLKQLCEDHQISLWNCYGPSEATFGYSMLRVNGLNVWSDGRLSSVPIGKAWGPEVKHHIIDGKLYIESPYLTPGYLNAAENSHYFMERVTESGNIRLFDTQDRFGEQDGNLYYLGRCNDGHCKINGIKVTQHFIESCMNDYANHNPLTQIQAAVVIKTYLQHPKPFAYVAVPKGFDKLAFNKYLKENLKPEEMPIIIPLDVLPRMQPSDKINRQALIRREDDVDAWLRDVPPACATPLVSHTEQVRAIWRNIFQRQAILDDVEFLFLGGTSLTAVEMVRQIQITLDSSYSYQTLLQLSTITVQTIAQSVHQNLSSKEGFDAEKALIQLLQGEENPKNKTPLFCSPALLGEGCFSYRKLAQSMSIHISQPMYGLSDPGILNEAWLPKSMDHAVSRYVAAIRTIQPKGPYELLGFSFGSTLASEVARRLLKEGEWVKKLHLIDSFPPMIYQALNEEDRASLLQALLNFLLPVFNNRFYAEHLLPIHAESGFLRLRKQLKNPQSHRLLAIAQRHLEFMEQAPIPEEPLPLSPIIYFTKRDQVYLNVINQIGISKFSADYRFYGWNRYFNSVRRSGIELDCEHLDVLKKKHMPQRYWERDRNAFFNVSRDFDGPKTSYHWQSQGGLWKLSVYFLTLEEARILEKHLCNRQLTPTVYLHEKKVTKLQEKDYLIHSIATLVCMVPNQLKEGITAWVEELRYNPLPEPAWLQPIALNQKRAEKPQAIDLHLLLGSSIYMTLTFYIDAASNVVIKALHQQLHYPAKPEVIEQHVQYFIPLGLEDSPCEAVNNVGQDIANFISVIQPALQAPSAQKQSYPKQPGFFHASYLKGLCKKYKLSDQSPESLEKGLRNAANNNQLSDIKLFLTSDIDINAADIKQNKTALYWATRKGWSECVNYLQAHGARM